MKFGCSKRHILTLTEHLRLRLRDPQSVVCEKLRRSNVKNYGASIRHGVHTFRAPGLHRGFFFQRFATQHIRYHPLTSNRMQVKGIYVD